MSVSTSSEVSYSRERLEVLEVRRGGIAGRGPLEITTVLASYGAPERTLSQLRALAAVFFWLRRFVGFDEGFSLLWPWRGLCFHRHAYQSGKRSTK